MYYLLIFTSLFLILCYNREIGGFKMKYQRHKRKETFSVLLISNTDRSSRQFQISLFALRLVFVLLLILGIALGIMIYLFCVKYKEENALRKQLNSQKKLTQQLEADIQTLHQANKQKEIAETTKSAAETTKSADHTKATENKQNVLQETELEKDSTFPGRYPSKSSGVLGSTYSPEHPFLSINTNTGSNVVATADGTITAISSDAYYKHIIVITHESGYITRYMCNQEAELIVNEGMSVHAGDILLNISIDNTQLDYQILKGEVPIDPLTLIDAKG